MKLAIVAGWISILFLGGFFLGFSGSVDDAHITYWSAWILASKGEILNYNLERVEQSSALLQVFLLAMFYKLTAVSVVTLGHILTILASLVAIVVVARLSAGVNTGMIWPAVILVSTTPFFVYWTFGGMEGPLLALLLLIMVKIWSDFLECKAGLPLLLAVTGLAQLARPEMLLVCCASALFIVLIFVVRTVDGKCEARRLAVLVMCQFILAGTIVVARSHYFGDEFPQPVSAKAGDNFLVNIFLGLDYLRDVIANPALCMTAILTLVSLCYCIAVFRKGMPSILLVATVLAATYIGFVVASGGDWMAAGRFWVPVVPLCAFICAYAIVQLLPRRDSRWPVLVVLLVCHVTYLWRGVGIDFNGVPLWAKVQLVPADQAERYSFFERHGREHLHDMPTLAFTRPLVSRILQLRPDRPVRIMAGQAGMVMFYLGQDFPGQIRVTDRNGLIDRTFTQCRLATSLPRTRNGLGNGYAWIAEHIQALEADCKFELPDLVFDIETGWNKANTDALRGMGYTLVYQQRGYIGGASDWLPIRKIGAGQYVAVSPAIYKLLGSPAPVERIFGEGT